MVCKMIPPSLNKSKPGNVTSVLAPTGPPGQAVNALLRVEMASSHTPVNVLDWVNVKGQLQNDQQNATSDLVQAGLTGNVGNVQQPVMKESLNALALVKV
jgi:hypothetical protein